MFYVGLLIVRLCFMSDSVLFIDWLYCIDLSSCMAASVFNKLTFFTYFTRRALRAGETEKQWRKLKAKQICSEKTVPVKSLKSRFR